ncbi:11354_t:CDS:2, partial [Cetraspora pellucida]
MDFCETSNIEWNNPDNTYVCLDSDFSLATDNVSEMSSVSNINDDNSHKFLFNYEAFQKTHESIHNIDDDVTMNDIKDDSSFISSERNSNDFNAQEEDYEIDDISCEKLVPCIVLDIYDGEIRHCPNYEKPVNQLRPLRQLVGTWEIDESVVDKNNPKIEQSTTSITKKPTAKTSVRFICSKCFQNEGGHLFERKGTGVKSYTCHDQHVDENKNALILLGRWLTAIAEFNDEELKQDTLNEMTVVLSKAYYPTTKNDKRNITNRLTLMPSLLLIKTIMRLEKNVRSNIIQNKTVLESPESFDQYRNGFPNFLRNFFDSFITFIQKKKYQICLKKQKQRKGKIEEFDSEIFAKAKASPKDYLFEIGTTTFTNQMNLKFENTFHSLSIRDEKELDVDKVFEELIKRIVIKPGCQVLAPNIVILEPGNNPCSDKAVHKACSEEKLKSLISSIQTERECLDLLLRGYVGDDIIIPKDRKIISRYIIINSLKSSLIQAFTQQNFTELFKNATEYTTEGFNNLFTCYDLGIERLKNIHSQEITKEIPYTTKGRRKKN